MNGIKIDSYLSDPSICKNSKGVEVFFRYFLTTNIVIKNTDKKHIQSIALIIKNNIYYDDNNLWDHIYLIDADRKTNEYKKEIKEQTYSNDILYVFLEAHNALVWKYINENISKIKSIN